MDGARRRSSGKRGEGRRGGDGDEDYDDDFDDDFNDDGFDDDDFNGDGDDAGEARFDQYEGQTFEDLGVTAWAREKYGRRTFAPESGVVKSAAEGFLARKACGDDLHAPTAHATGFNAHTTPENDLQLDFAYGYRGHDTSSNGVYNADGKIGYATGGDGHRVRRGRARPRFFYVSQRRYTVYVFTSGHGLDRHGAGGTGPSRVHLEHEDASK